MFIELTIANSKCKVLVNTDQIVSIYPTVKVDSTHRVYATVVKTTNGGYWEVSESLDEIKSMLNSIPISITTSIGQLDELYEDADRGICSNIQDSSKYVTDKLNRGLYNQIIRNRR